MSPDDGMVYFSDITFTPIVQGSFGQVRGGWQHLEIGSKDQTGDHFSLAKRAGSRDEI